MTSELPDSDVLGQYVTSALEQWKYTAPFIRDQREVSRHTKRILYSVDTDIVKLFTNPLNVAPAVPGRPYGYLQLFYDDKPAECIARGRIVADHIFRKLNGGLPLLIIPPLTRELMEIHDTVADQAHSQQFRAQHQLRELKDRLEAIRKEGDVTKLFSVMSRHAPHLVRLIEGESDSTAELRRFSILLRDQLIAGPDFFIKRRLVDEPLLDALQSILHISLSSDIDIEEHRRAWADLLAKPEYKAGQAARDADALARLQFINEHLPPAVTFVHITGDAHVLMAGESITLSDGRTFTESYLRHPRAFLAEPGMLLLDETSSVPDDTLVGDGSLSKEFSEFSKWLIVFLARFWKKSITDINASIENPTGLATASKINPAEIKEFCGDFPEIVTAFRERWDKFSHNLILGHTRKMLDTMPYLRNISADLKASFDEIETQVYKYIDESWRSSFQVATATSYGMTRVSADRTIAKASKRVLARSVPLVSFESFPKTTQFIKEIIEATSLAEIGSERYAHIFKTIEVEDSSGYLYYLAYATLFSAEGRWPLARILSERSFWLRHFSNNADISGREAAYFCAVSIRNSARSSADVAAGFKWLKVAEDCWARDKERRPQLNISKVRFDVERQSLTFASLLFRLFLDRLNENQVSNDVLRLNELRDAFDALLPQVSAGVKTQDAHEEWVHHILQRRILINLLMIALIRAFRCGQVPNNEEWQTLKAQYDLLVLNTQADVLPNVADNYLYYVVYRLAGLWLDRVDFGQVNETKQVLTESLIERYATAPYDLNRFSFFRRTIEEISATKTRW